MSDARPPSWGVGTVSSPGGPTAVVVAADHVLPLRSVDSMLPGTVDALIADWARLRAPLTSALEAATPSAFPHVTEVTWLAPHRPSKILCVGTNYRDHVAEMAGPAGLTGGSLPFPYSFMKPDTSLCGSGAAVPHPAYGRQLDWEVELAVVIGDAAAAGSDPLRAVFGYTVFNDLSLRDFIPFPHALGLDALVSKGFDGAAPTGPWITPAEWVGDPQDLHLELTVNGEVMQSSRTDQMIFGVADLVAHYARVLSLAPGDLIATGTPAGVGVARRPPRFLQPGDELIAEIEGLGRLKTTIAEPGAPFRPLEPGGG